MDQRVAHMVDQKVTIVVRVVEHEQDGLHTRVNGVSPDQLFYLDGIFGRPDEIWTLYDIQRVGIFLDHPVMALGKDSEAFCHQFRGVEDYTAAWDFCSGIGALGWGAKHAGFRLLGHNDQGWLACAATCLNSRAPIVKGSIHEQDTVRGIHRVTNGQRFIGMAGFPCQPYSRQGSRQEAADPRFHRLCFWQRGACGLLLECVPEAGTSKPVREQIQKYMEATGFQIFDHVLDLADRWISRRRRWWALILPADGLQTWGKQDPDPLPGHLLRDWPHWDVELNLQRDQNETDHYDSIEYGTENRRLVLGSRTTTMSVRVQRTRI